MRIWLEEQEVTGLCVQGITEKNSGGAAAEGRFRFVCAPENGALPRINPACGQWIVVKEGDKILFSGEADKVRYDAGSRMVTVECFDPAIRLARYFPEGSFSGTPEEIVGRMCAQCGLTPGKLAAGEGRVSLYCAGERSAFSYIKSLYGGAAVADYENGRLNLRLLGEEEAETGDRTVVALTAGNARTEDGVRREAVVTVIGETSVRCGQRICMERPQLGVWGDYIIARLKRTWEKGRTTVTIGLVSV